jgi:hypothetical protein
MHSLQPFAFLASWGQSGEENAKKMLRITASTAALEI